ncbi:glutamyl-tRNA amidotransferase subunit A [Rhizodiscina lignyota]|uniref:Glutamyl-tRNA(Gln) amidotransferase subunit A, mitochondrial n=1 Tax=Rhizodiscina lignyota TaxID=1504668 RepID=A0A9P4M3S0_9PEZI|nr:glutamyl-tRNA amidotransferase subunit A [Rhizodiscina lignyota]
MSLLREAQRCIANQAARKQFNAFIAAANPDNLLYHSGPLNGHLIAIKDNICTKDLPTTAASGILRSFTSPYDATVVLKLQSAGAVIAGKTNLDEFGMGSHSTYSYFGPVSQNVDGKALSAGGSSGGSAIAVAGRECWAALGTDTGGSVRLPAAYTGIVGFKPSYGLISRWGVIAYANSLDTVGILSRDVRVARDIFDVLSEHDRQDPTSIPVSIRKGSAKSHRKDRHLRIGIPSEYNVLELSPAVRKSWLSIISALREHYKATVSFQSVSLPTTRLALPAYYVLAPAEASSNLAKYDGVRYGSRAADAASDAPDRSPLFARTRGEGFGNEVKRRILLGTYSLSAAAIDNYFIQAQRARRLVQRDFDRVFRASNPLLSEEPIGHETADHVVADDGKVDVLLHPTAPTLPPTLDTVRGQTALETYTNDVFTVPASLAGLPAISVPVASVDEQSIETKCGMQVVGQFGNDETVLDVAEMIENLTGREAT